MTTPPSSPVPAGWYPDPEGGSRLRWWDGTQWTAHLADAAPAAAQPYQAASAQTYEAASAQPYSGTAATLSAPAGTRWNTPWIWLVLLLPLLPAIPLLFLDWGKLVRIDPVTMEPDPYAQLALVSSPAYLASVFGGWIAYALTVVFAYLDWRELNRRGIPRPFHWAFAFLSGYVYGIGRAVVTRRRGAGGGAVLATAITVLVLSVLLGIGIAVGVTLSVLTQIPFS